MNNLDAKLAATPFLLALIGISACSQQATMKPPRFALEQCARTTLIDRQSGREIVGAEDLDVDRAGGRLFISAYDRKAVERAAKQRTAVIPKGGLYVVSLDDLAGRNKEIRARSIVDSESVNGGLRPHGIAYDEATGDLTFVNRGYAKYQRQWRLQAEVLTLASSGEWAAAHPVKCSANDLTILDGRPLITLDHGGCGFSAGMEDVLGLKRARLVEAGGESVVEGLGLANGVVAVPGGLVFVAATRERALYPITVGRNRAERHKAIPLGAAPDNLSLSDEGAIIAAVHPSLLAIGLQRRLGAGRSPSRIIEIVPETGDKALLFDDREASLISAATAAISTNGLLVIGSVVDAGIVVCRSDA